MSIFLGGISREKGGNTREKGGNTRADSSSFKNENMKWHFFPWNGHFYFEMGKSTENGQKSNQNLRWKEIWNQWISRYVEIRLLLQIENPHDKGSCVQQSALPGITAGSLATLRYRRLPSFDGELKDYETATGTAKSMPCRSLQPGHKMTCYWTPIRKLVVSEGCIRWPWSIVVPLQLDRYMFPKYWFAVKDA